MGSNPGYLLKYFLLYLFHHRWTTKPEILNLPFSFFFVYGQHFKNTYLTAFVTEFFRLPTKKMATSSFSIRSSLVLLSFWRKWPKMPKNWRKWPKFLKYLPDCLCYTIFLAANQNDNFILFFSFRFSLAQILAKMAKTAQNTRLFQKRPKTVKNGQTS